MFCSSSADRNHLSGFMSKKLVEQRYNYKGSYFLIPNEKAGNGTTAVFHSFIEVSTCLLFFASSSCSNSSRKVMIKEDVASLCYIKLRENAEPKLAALLPQRASDVDDVPAGFHVVFLPFKGNIRETSSHLSYSLARSCQRAGKVPPHPQVWYPPSSHGA